MTPTLSSQFVLARAALSLYPADANGLPIRSQPVWSGARQEGLTIPREIAEVEDTASGRPNDQYSQLSEQSQITIARVWTQNKAALSEYDFSRGQFVMEIFDQDPVSQVWVRWTAYGCQAVRYEKHSAGVTYFLSNQVWRVTGKWQFETGRGAVLDPVELVVDEHSLLFTHDDALASGDYFVGAYQFTSNLIRVIRAKAIAQASQSMATVLTLEVDGALTPVTLTLPAGSVGVEVTDETTVTYDITANQIMRWKVTSGPAVGQALLAGVTMLVQEIAA